MISIIFSYFFSKKSFVTGVIHKSFEELVPNSLPFMEQGPEWRRHRLAMSPFFAKEQVENWSSDMWSIIKEEYDDLATTTDKSSRLVSWVNFMLSRIIMKTMFNVTVDKKNEEEVKRFKESVNFMGDWIALVLICNIVCPPIARTQYMKKFVQNKNLFV